MTIGNRGTILQSEYLVRPALLSARAVAGGIELSLAGDVGATYRVETSEQLPALEWLPLGTFTLTQPATNFVDATAINLGQRFYRAISP